MCVAFIIRYFFTFGSEETLLTVITASAIDPVMVVSADDFKVQNHDLLRCVLHRTKSD